MFSQTALNSSSVCTLDMKTIVNLSLKGSLLHSFPLASIFSISVARSLAFALQFAKLNWGKSSQKFSIRCSFSVSYLRKVSSFSYFQSIFRLSESMQSTVPYLVARIISFLISLKIAA
jgi:hypothetical protein